MLYNFFVQLLVINQQKINLVQLKLKYLITVQQTQLFANVTSLSSAERKTGTVRYKEVFESREREREREGERERGREREGEREREREDD